VVEEKLKKLGSNIRRVREERGFTQEAFAQEFGIDRAYYGRIERGQINLSAKMIFMLAHALETSPDQFFAVDRPQEKTDVK
jgi:transcriptional regulator with XRE-family HTH domain